MEINLEKIDLVKERTGSSYAEAKAALERADGSVVDAIIDIEEQKDKDFNAVDGPSLKDSPIFEKMKKIVEKGNITKIVVKKNGGTVISCPVTIGVAGIIIVPWVVILSVVAALGSQCTINFEDEFGQVIDLNGKVIGKAFKAVDIATEGTKMGEVKDFGKKVYEKGYSKLSDAYNKANADGKIDNAVKDVKNFAGKAADKAIKLAEEAAKKIDNK